MALCARRALFSLMRDEASRAAEIARRQGPEMPLSAGSSCIGNMAIGHLGSEIEMLEGRREDAVVVFEERCGRKADEEPEGE